MTTAIEIRDLPGRINEALARAVAGEKVVLLDGTTPRARLVPIENTTGNRVAGLHAGAIQPAPDFDAPLPEEFWTGQSCNCCWTPTRSCGGTATPGNSQLSAPALTAIRDPANEVWFSVVNIWEMVIKAQLKKLTLRLPIGDIVAQQLANGLRVLDVNVAHVLAVETLPNVHKDPFDRLLAAQTNAEGVKLVTNDPVFAQFPVPLLW